MDSGGSKKRSPIGNSKTTRIIIFVAGLAVLVIAALIFVSVLSSKSQQPVEEMISVVQKQSELINLADTGTKKARTTEALNLAYTTKLSLETDQRTLGSYIATQKRGFSASKYTSLKNAQIQAALVKAEQSNSFDETFLKLLNQELTSYKASIKRAYDNATSTKAKTVLSDTYNHATALAPKK